MFQLLETNIFILADWERDSWKRAYFSVNTKKALVTYTCSRKEARNKTYPINLGAVSDCFIKMPSKTKSFTPSEVPSERRASFSGKRESTSPLVEADSKGYESSTNVEVETVEYQMRLIDGQGKEVALLKSMQL